MRLLSFLLAVLLTSVTSEAANTVKLASGEWPPYAGESLPEGGIGTRIIRAALSEEGITAEFEYLSWKRGLEIAKQGMLDGAILWVALPERENDFLFSDPIMTSDTVLLYRKNKPLEDNKPIPLDGLQFGIANGYSYTKKPVFTNMVRESGKTAVVVADDLAGIKALIQERIDVFPTDRQVGHWILSNLAKPDVPILIHEPPLWVEKLVVLFSRKSPRSKWLQERLNSGLAKLRASGQLKAWLHEAAPPAP